MRTKRNSALSRPLNDQHVSKPCQPFDRLIENAGVLGKTEAQDMLRPLALEQRRDGDRRDPRLANRAFAERAVVERDPRCGGVNAEEPGAPPGRTTKPARASPRARWSRDATQVARCVVNQLSGRSSPSATAHCKAGGVVKVRN